MAGALLPAVKMASGKEEEPTIYTFHPWTLFLFMKNAGQSKSLVDGYSSFMAIAGLESQLSVQPFDKQLARFPFLDEHALGVPHRY